MLDEGFNVEIEEKELRLVEGKMLKIYINHKFDQVHIPNIVLPDFIQRKEIGKKIIAKIFRLPEIYEYELFIVEMANNFYEKLLKR